jgi:hypothetical protein
MITGVEKNAIIIVGSEVVWESLWTMQLNTLDVIVLFPVDVSFFVV